MSASLVGSEMCIRDSSTVIREVLFVMVVEGRKGIHTGKGVRGKVPAVSYTHLTLPTICSV
eukprot:8609338-Alexandrium_andersonii.AAC.1